MKRIALLCLVAFSALAHAAPADPVLFDERVRLAKQAEDDEQFKAYPHALYRQARRHVANAMRSCIAASPRPKSRSFVLVADITAQGRADAVAVKPDNAVARCFAARFAAASYPQPPAYPGRDGFPVTLRVGVAR